MWLHKANRESKWNRTGTINKVVSCYGKTTHCKRQSDKKSRHYNKKIKSSKKDNMGLMISSIAKIGNNLLPKNMFKANSDYYLYILEYSDFDFQETHNYSTELHNSGMSRILNNYQYNFEDSRLQKLESETFHSDKVMSYRNIFDIENLNIEETKPAIITPAFLFTTIQPNNLNKINSSNISNDEFILLKIKFQDRDANRIPQLVNEMLSNIGQTVSKCKQSSVTSKYENVYVFNYCSELTKTKTEEIKTEIIMGDKFEIKDISNNSGQINIGKDIKTKTEVNANDELAKKSYNWQRRDTIIMVIIGVIGLVIAYFSK